MKFFVALALSFSTLTVVAQRVVDVSKENVNVNNFLHVVGGEPVGYTKFVNLKEGSPFFTDRWLNSSIVLQNGTTFKDIPVKLNLMENKLHYLDVKGNEMITTSAIKEVVLANDAKDSLFRFVAASTLAPAAKDGWYLWLQSGKASLYQVISKELTEEKPYGSATTEQRIKTKKDYVIVYNNALFGFSKIKQVPAILANKKTELETYLQKQNKNSPEEERIAELISFYNTLL